MKRSFARVTLLESRLRSYSSKGSDASDGFKRGRELLKEKISQLKLSNGFKEIQGKKNSRGINSAKSYANASFATASHHIDDGFMDVMNSLKPKKSMIPKEIKRRLDEYIIGQDGIKRAISNAVYSHYKRLEHNLFSQDKGKRENNVVIEKSNVLLLGPTGCGKTLIAKTTAQLIDVPFSMNDATPFTQAGYVGEDVESCIAKLLQNADYDVKRAERGIVFIDEIDKIAKKTDMFNKSQKDVSGEGVQHGLLRILEGTKVTINLKQGAASKNYGSGPFEVDTSNILFICSGAFVGLDKVIQERCGKKGSIGFDKFVKSAQDEEIQEPLQSVESDDLIKFGLIPEFIGRLPIIASASALSVHNLIDILNEPKNALLKQYQEIFHRSDIQLRFHPESMTKIAQLAIEKKTGARGLRRIIENVLNDALFEYAGSSIKYIVVDQDLGIKAFDDSESDQVAQFLEK